MGECYALGDENPNAPLACVELGLPGASTTPTGQDRTSRQTATSEPKAVNALEDMQLSAYGQRSLVLGGTIPESLIRVTDALRGPK